MKGGVNSIDVKRSNRNKVFRYVAGREKTSMPDIAANLEISTPTVLQIVKELKGLGVIREVGELESTGGRKAKALEMSADVRYAAGIDITRNHMTFVLTDLSEKVLKRVRLRKEFVFEEQYFREMGIALDEFMGEDRQVKERLAGVGISVPSIMDAGRKFITYSRALDLYQTSCDMFTRYIPYPSALLNDANAAALSECAASVQPASMVYLSLSNTVGGSILFNQEQGAVGVRDPYSSVFGNMYVGYHQHSGEFGHMVIHPGGRRCYCGKSGCADAYCSALKLTEHTKGSLEQFFKGMDGGNELFREIWDEYLDDLAIVVDNLIMCFDCEVVLGGYVGSMIEPYIQDLRTRLKEKSIFESEDQFVRACKYQIDASALGAAIFFIEEFIDHV